MLEQKTESFLEKCKLLKEKGKIKVYEKGEIIITEGTEGYYLYLVLCGTVDVVLYSPGGRRIILNTLKEGDFFGEMSVLEGLPRSANVEARTDCEILEISRENFFETVRTHPECALAILTELCSRLRAANEKIRILSIPSAEERIKSYIELLWSKNKEEKD